MEDLCEECGKIIDPDGPGYVFENKACCDSCHRMFLNQLRASQRSPEPVVPQPVPEFLFLRVVAAILLITGALCCLGGVITVLLYGFSKDDPTSTTPAFLQGIAICCGGILSLAFGECMGCLRLMTINSFHISRHILKEKA